MKALDAYRDVMNAVLLFGGAMLVMGLLVGYYIANWQHKVREKARKDAREELRREREAISGKQ